MLACACVCWRVGVFWCVLVALGAFWCILVCPCVSWCVVVCGGVCLVRVGVCVVCSCVFVCEGV